MFFSDGDELKKSLSELADNKTDNAHTKISRISSGSNPFLDIAHDPNAAVHKTGFLARKIHADMDGKKSKTCYRICEHEHYLFPHFCSISLRCASFIGFVFECVTALGCRINNIDSIKLLLSKHSRILGVLVNRCSRHCLLFLHKYNIKLNPANWSFNLGAKTKRKRSLKELQRNMCWHQEQVERWTANDQT